MIYFTSLLNLMVQSEECFDLLNDYSYRWMMVINGLGGCDQRYDNKRRALFWYGRKPMVPLWQEMRRHRSIRAIGGKGECINSNSHWVIWCNSTWTPSSPWHTYLVNPPPLHIPLMPIMPRRMQQIKLLLRRILPQLHRKGLRHDRVPCFHLQSCVSANFWELMQEHVPVE